LNFILITNLNRVPSNVTLEEAAFAEPLAVAVHANNRAQVTFGQRVLVCGAGTMGILDLMTAIAYGAVKTCILGITFFIFSLLFLSLFNE